MSAPIRTPCASVTEFVRIDSDAGTSDFFIRPSSQEVRTNHAADISLGGEAAHVMWSNVTTFISGTVLMGALGLFAFAPAAEAEKAGDCCKQGMACCKADSACCAATCRWPRHS